MQGLYNGASNTQKPTSYFATQEQGRAADVAVQRQREWPQVPAAAALVDDGLYSHFPVLAAGFDVVGVLYHRGRNHGQSDTAAICASQTPAAGGVQSLVINGNETTAGVVTGVLRATEVTVTSAGNDTGRIFTVTGTLNGVPVVRSGAGGNASTVTLVGSIDPNSITSVTVDGNPAGAVTVGLLRIAADIVYAWSENGGATFPNEVILGDGMTDGQTIFYYPALGRRKDGSLIAIFSTLDVTTGARTRYQTTSLTGKDDWTPLQVMAISGLPSVAIAWYGQIKILPSGDQVASIYTGNDNYVVVSDDWQGTSWTAHLIATSASPGLSEQAIAIIDENNWLTLLRVDAAVSGMRTAKTSDRGVTWSVPAETNLPASGGYQSHELNVIDVDGVRYVFMTYMARSVLSSPPPTPDAICARWTTAALALAAPTNWGSEISLVPELLDSSGYPSLFINPDSGKALMAYGKETAIRAAAVRTISVDVAALINAPKAELVAERVPLLALAAESVALLDLAEGANTVTLWTPTISCAVLGDLALTPTGTPKGYIIRVGRLVFVTAEWIGKLEYSTATGAVRMEGMPESGFPDMQQISGSFEFAGLTKAGFTQFVPRIGPSADRFNFKAMGSGVTTTDLQITDFPSSAGTDKRFLVSACFIT